MWHKKASWALFALLVIWAVRRPCTQAMLKRLRCYRGRLASNSKKYIVMNSQNVAD